MKQSKKLVLRKVTLRDLDDKQLDAVIGGCCPTVNQRTCLSCPVNTCAKPKS